MSADRACLARPRCLRPFAGRAAARSEIDADGLQEFVELGLAALTALGAQSIPGGEQQVSDLAHPSARAMWLFTALRARSVRSDGIRKATADYTTLWSTIEN